MSLKSWIILVFRACAPILASLTGGPVPVLWERIMAVLCQWNAYFANGAAGSRQSVRPQQGLSLLAQVSYIAVPLWPGMGTAY